MKTLIFFSLLVSTLAWSVPETDLPQDWTAKIEPFFRAMKSGTLKNKEGLTLKYFSLTNTRNDKSLVIVPGRTEPALKYAELIYDLKDLGFDIYIMDHQGQGESSRILADTNKGHVKEFKNYVTDFELFMNQVVHRSSNPVYLIAHSLGGAITTHYMAAHKTVFKKAVLVAPMLEMNTAPYSETIARYYSKLLVTVGKGNNYAPDYGPYKPETDVFETNVYTHSPARFDVTKHIFVAYPALVVGGPTARWVHESLLATKDTEKLSIETPILMFQAGLDQTVKPGRQDSFCKKGHQCELIHIPDAFHEILMEKDVIRDDVLNQIKLFFGV
jgi:lysophospholipase